MHLNLSPVRKRARVVGVAAGVAIAALLLAGCTPSSNSTQKTLTVWHYYSLPNQLKMLKQYAATFEKDNPGITINDVYVPEANLNAKLVAAAGTKSGPCLWQLD